MGKTNHDAKSFWLSLPGFLTALAAFISAFTGLYVALRPPSGSSDKSSEKAKTQTSPASAPSPKKAGLQVVRLTSSLPGGTMVSNGFFTPKGFIVASTHTVANATQVVVTWASDGTEEHHQAVVLGPGDAAPEATLLKLIDSPPLGRDVPIRVSGSLQPGDKVARYVGLNDTTPGTVKEIYGQRPIAFGSGTRTFTRLLITTEIAGLGDSGAPVIDSEGRIVGMIFGASNTEAICIPIEDIKASFLDAF